MRCGSEKTKQFWKFNTSNWKKNQLIYKWSVLMSLQVNIKNDLSCMQYLILKIYKWKKLISCPYYIIYLWHVTPYVHI